MFRQLYTLFYYLILPLVLLRLWYRSLRAPTYSQRVRERFGLFTAPDLEGSIWIHAVSVGESIAATPLIKQLQLRYPHRPVVVTTMTPTGSEQIKAIFGHEVFHVYVPYDLPGSLARFLDKTTPSLLVIMETELWPNMIHACHARGTAVVLANARLSARSARGYHRLASLSASMLREMSQVAAQYSSDGERFLQLGLKPEQLSVTGSIKFDVTLSDATRSSAVALKQQWSNIDGGERRTIFIAASTHPGEDKIILAAFRRALEFDPNLLLLLVPRHQEQFPVVTALCQREGFAVVQRSGAEIVQRHTQVVIGDTMGELLMLYGTADIAFVGGSFVDSGGHNMLEAAVWGVPIISGPSTYNFSDISEKFQQANAMTIVDGESELAATLLELLQEPEKRLRMGAAAARVVEENRGSLERLLDCIDRHLY